MDRKNIEKIADNPEDKILLARLWDKISAGYQKNILTHTQFLSPREIQLAQYLFGDQPNLYIWGGYDDSERKMFIHLPDYISESYLQSEDSPIVCLRASYYRDSIVTHRDILGALIGCGITRQSIGDILIGEQFCDFFVTAEIAEYILENFQSAGRVSLKVSRISMEDAIIPEPKIVLINDTLASVRLDSVIASGFRISRTVAAEYISAGKTAIDGLPCEKPDKTVEEGNKISVRGLGKIKLFQIGHTTKKGRISIIIHRYQ